MISEQENSACSANPGKINLDFERICSLTSKSDSISKISICDNDEFNPVNIQKSLIKIKSDFEHKKKAYHKKKNNIENLTISSYILKMKEKLKKKNELDKTQENNSGLTKRKKIFRRTDHYIKKKSAQQLVDAWQLALGDCKDDCAFNNETKKYMISIHLEPSYIYRRKLKDNKQNLSMAYDYFFPNNMAYYTTHRLCSDQIDFSKEFVKYKKGFCIIKNLEKKSFTIKIDQLLKDDLTSPDHTRKAISFVNQLYTYQNTNPNMIKLANAFKKTIVDLGNARSFAIDKGLVNSTNIMYIKNFGESTIRHIEECPYFCIKYFCNNEYHYAPIMNKIKVNQKLCDKLKLKINQNDQYNGLQAFTLFQINDFVDYYIKYFTRRVHHVVSNNHSRIEEPDFLLNTKEAYFQDTSGQIVECRILAYIIKYFKGDCLHEKLYLVITD